MEDKENVNGSTRNRKYSTLGENIVSPKALKSPTVLKQIGTATNCNSPSSTTAVSEPVENKNKGISFSKTFLLNRNVKEKQLKITTPNPGACLSEKRVLGSYRGRIVSSKINSFRKVLENEDKRHSLAVPPKSVVRTGSTESSKCTRDTRIAITVGASKPEGVVLLQNRPTVRVSVSHPKPILSHEKQFVSSALVRKGEAKINHVRNWKPTLKAVPPNTNSVHTTKKPSGSKVVRESLAGPLSETRSTVSASKSVYNRNSLLTRSSEVRRTQLAEWQSRKGVKKPTAPIFTDTQTKIETIGQTAKEPAKSFWAAIAEEDEQGLFSDGVNKTLAECLSLIEKGYASEAVHSTLEKLILQVPDAKKLAKYWVCQMRLEQFRSTEKVLGIYESAILAGAQPKDELRHALADAMKATTNLRKSDEECVRKEITQNDEAKEVNSDKNEIDIVSKEAPLNKNMESSNEENFPKAEDACLTSEQESFSVEKNLRNEQNCKPALHKKEEESDRNTDKDEILEFKTPETDNMGSYLIKYNLSTTPYLESAKKKLQCEVNDSAVKDLKYLTPVRRSRRINEKMSKLPKEVKEHSLCVSSLEELGEMGDDGTGFIYRQNSALQKVYPQELSKE